MAEIRLEMGSTVALPRREMDTLLARLRKLGYETIGPSVRDGSLVYAPVETLSDLPRGYTSEQDGGRFRLVYSGHSRCFDITPGPHTWKQFLFPPRSGLVSLRREGGSWSAEKIASPAPRRALIGVRACELAALDVQDRVFLRDDYTDPIYRDGRHQVFIVAVSCLRPGGTCFCASMGTGPKAKHGYDLALTELEDQFLVEIGSDIGRSVMSEIPCQQASAFLLRAAQQGHERAEKQMGREMVVEGLPEFLLANLDHPRWDDVARRCLSCANCTQVCPTCFCWDVHDHTNLPGTLTHRERVWDSCFNPGYSYMAGGNTRPTVRSRYRQWLSHKLGSWKEQFDALGCVGCGRCITWCPVGIDITAEVAAMRKEARA